MLIYDQYIRFVVLLIRNIRKIQGTEICAKIFYFNSMKGLT